MDWMTLTASTGDIWLLDDDRKAPTLITEDDDNYKYFKKLAEYEELEKQGRLIKIPCVFGDVVYVIPSKVTYKINVVNGKMDRNHVYKQVVSGVAPSKSGYVFYTCNNQNVLLEEEYKKTWFLTEQEANDALQKMNEMEATENENRK